MSRSRTAATMPLKSVTTLPGRACDYCGESFTALRHAQRFCPASEGRDCRAAYHRERYRREAHGCPLCGAEHDPPGQEREPPP